MWSPLNAGVLFSSEQSAPRRRPGGNRIRGRSGARHQQQTCRTRRHAKGESRCGEIYAGVGRQKQCHCLCTRASWGVARMYVGDIGLKYSHCMCTQLLESGYPSDGVLHRGGGFRDVHKPFFDANLGKKIRVSILRVGVSASVAYANHSCQRQ